MLVLGIDPGKKGGLSIYNGKDIVHLSVMPIDSAGRIDVLAIRDVLRKYNIGHTVIEKQQVRGNQGGGLTTGSNYGRITAVLDLEGIAFTEISAQSWQNALDLSAEKPLTIVWCEEELKVEIPWTSYKKDGTPMARATKHDGVADAVAISVYGHFLVTGENK